jgi:hypothetical protein
MAFYIILLHFLLSGGSFSGKVSPLLRPHHQHAANNFRFHGATFYPCSVELKIVGNTSKQKHTIPTNVTKIILHIKSNVRYTFINAFILCSLRCRMHPVYLIPMLHRCFANGFIFHGATLYPCSVEFYDIGKLLTCKMHTYQDYSI